MAGINTDVRNYVSKLVAHCELADKVGVDLKLLAEDIRSGKLCAEQVAQLLDEQAARLNRKTTKAN